MSVSTASRWRSFISAASQPELLEIVSKHQNRFRLGDLGDLRHLFEHYTALLRTAGLSETSGWPYAFEHFDNGVRIPNLARAQYLSLGQDRSRFGDPFATDGEDSYWRWMNGSVRRRTPPFLSHLLFHLWETQRELQIAYPDPGGADLDRLAEWINVYGKQTHALPDDVLTALEPLQQQRSSPVTTARRTAKRLLKRTYESPPARAAKDWIKQRLGADRIRAVKRLLTPLSTGHPASSAVAGPHAQQSDLSRAGINVVGYIRTASGMGEGSRSIVRAAEAVGLSHSVSNVSFNVVSRMDDRTVGVRPDAPDYGINIFVVNADQVPAVAEHIGDTRFRAHYNVGAWVWEQDRFPTCLARCLQLFRRDLGAEPLLGRGTVDGLAPAGPANASPRRHRPEPWRLAGDLRPPQPTSSFFSSSSTTSAMWTGRIRWESSTRFAHAFTADETGDAGAQVRKL